MHFEKWTGWHANGCTPATDPKLQNQSDADWGNDTDSPYLALSLPPSLSFSLVKCMQNHPCCCMGNVRTQYGILCNNQALTGEKTFKNRGLTRSDRGCPCTGVAALLWGEGLTQAIELATMAKLAIFPRKQQHQRRLSSLIWHSDPSGWAASQSSLPSLSLVYKSLINFFITSGWECKRRELQWKALINTDVDSMFT